MVSRSVAGSRTSGSRASRASRDWGRVARQLVAIGGVGTLSLTGCGPQASTAEVGDLPSTGSNQVVVNFQPDGASGQKVVAEFVGVGSGFQMILKSPDGKPLERRVVEAEGSCAVKPSAVSPAQSVVVTARDGRPETGWVRLLVPHFPLKTGDQVSNQTASFNVSVGVKAKDNACSPFEVAITGAKVNAVENNLSTLDVGTTQLGTSSGIRGI